MSDKDSKGEGLTDLQTIRHTLDETIVLLETVADCVPKKYVVHDWRKDLAYRVGLLVGGLKTCSSLVQKIQGRPITPKEDKCKNPDCVNGRVFVPTGTFASNTIPCPDCEKYEIN